MNITVRLAQKYNIPCTIICDTSHNIYYDNIETITVNKGGDSADFRLVNLIKNDDIAVTQDYGLAAMYLSKNAVVINQNGKIYTDENISGLLEFRAVSTKIRKNGGRLKGQPKRTQEQNHHFKINLEEIIKNQLLK